MWQEILRAVPVYFSTMIKFIFGPLGGYAAGLTLMTTILVTIAGMMTVVLLFAFFGGFIRDKIASRIIRNKKRFTPKNRRFVRIWRRYGMIGVAALTPVLLTPIGGSALAVSFGTPRHLLILYMFISGSIWAVIFSVSVYFFGDEFIAPYFN
jgi:hypothetical protein